MDSKCHTVDLDPTVPISRFEALETSALGLATETEH